MKVARHLKLAAILLLGLTSLFTYFVVKDASTSDKLLGQFVSELMQNLYFVALVLTYLLWGAIMKLRETRLRLIQVVAFLGLYLSALAANYALHNMAPGHRHIWAYVPPIMAIALPLAWGFTFLKIPEGARLMTARVAVTMHK
jgi:hypothetical protein